jgi:hypothetical protein
MGPGGFRSTSEGTARHNRPPRKLISFLWERHLAAIIVAGSHSHKADTTLLEENSK